MPTLTHTPVGSELTQTEFETGTHRVIGGSLGDILYFDGDEVVTLPPSTAGYILSTQGVGSPPAWVSVPSITGPTAFVKSGVGAPPYAFSGDLDTGVDSYAANRLNLVAGGLNVVQVDTSSVSITVSTPTNTLYLTNSDAGALGVRVITLHDTATPAAADIPYAIIHTGKNSAAATVNYAYDSLIISDPTAATEDAYWSIQTLKAGVLAERLTIGRAASGFDLEVTSGLGILAGNLTFAGTGQRITGDMSNATRASRLAIQTSTVNTSTVPSIIPNGTGTVAGVNFFNTSDPDAGGFLNVQVSATIASLTTGKTGAGVEPTSFSIISAAGNMLTFNTTTRVGTFATGLAVTTGGIAINGLTYTTAGPAWGIGGETGAVGKSVIVGLDTTGNIGYISSLNAGTAFLPLRLKGLNISLWTGSTSVVERVTITDLSTTVANLLNANNGLIAKGNAGGSVVADVTNSTTNVVVQSGSNAGANNTSALITWYRSTTIIGQIGNYGPGSYIVAGRTNVNTDFTLLAGPGPTAATMWDASGNLYHQGTATLAGALILKNTIGSLASSADEVRLGSYDLSAGNATLSMSTEVAVVSEAVVSDRTLQVRINGVTYKILLKS